MIKKFFFISKGHGSSDRETLGMSVAAVNAYSIATAPRWWFKSGSEEYYQGRVSVYRDDDFRFWFDNIPCDNGKFLIDIFRKAQNVVKIALINQYCTHTNILEKNIVV